MYVQTLRDLRYVMQNPM